jgi:AmmeMemoRadiSam system protein B
MLRATHAGSWYPTGNPLTTLLRGNLEKITPATAPGLVRAIIVPHAGYTYCLETSLHAFAQVDPSLYDRVVVIGPSHQVPINCCTIANANTAECPLGNLPFDTAMVDTLINNHPNLFAKLALRQAELEHSLEMEFPILKFIFKEKPFTIVPIMVGSIGAEKSAEVAAALRPFADQRTLFVISSDFCHWGARFGFTYLPPGTGQVFERIEALDRMATEKISTGNPAQFAAYLEETKNTICGRWAITIAMNLWQGWTASWPRYSQSSNITSTSDSSVSYMAGVIRTP